MRKSKKGRRSRSETAIITIAVASGHVGILRLERVLTFANADEHRHEFCPNYDKCLTHAGSLHWVSFTCALCAGDPGIE